MIEHTLHIRSLSALTPYDQSFAAMRHFTDTRDQTTPDEVWFLQHPPVFTQGQNGKPEHVLQPGDIPVVQTDRGGQVTYHGPGQLMIYTLIDLKRKHLQVRPLVTLLEQTIIDFLASQGVLAYSKKEAPGIYTLLQTQETKMCSIGLRIRKGYSYHGLAFNIAMSLEPFTRINPCGFNQLKMSQLQDFIPHCSIDAVIPGIIEHLKKHLFYTTIRSFNQLPG